jgi:hypothetical protein
MPLAGWRDVPARFGRLTGVDCERLIELGDSGLARGSGLQAGAGHGVISWVAFMCGRGIQFRDYLDGGRMAAANCYRTGSYRMKLRAPRDARDVFHLLAFFDRSKGLQDTLARFDLLEVVPDSLQRAVFGRLSKDFAVPCETTAPPTWARS